MGTWYGLVVHDLRYHERVTNGNYDIYGIRYGIWLQRASVERYGNCTHGAGKAHSNGAGHAVRGRHNHTDGNGDL